MQTAHQLGAGEAVGYQVEARLLDAWWLGVVQMRQRVIFVGVRQDLADATGAAPVFPAPLTYRYPLSIVCPDIVCPDIVRLEVRGPAKPAR